MSLFQPRTCFNPSPFSAVYEFIVEPEPEPQPMHEETEEIEPCMEEKQAIMEEREEKKKKMLPGQKLLKKLYKKQQVEDALVRVVKNLNL